VNLPDPDGSSQDHHWQKMTPPELDYNDARLEAMLARLLP
jgi:hypothetical protein